MEIISDQGSVLLKQQEIPQIIEKVAEFCKAGNVGLLLIHNENISQPIVKGSKLALNETTRNFVKKGFAAKSYFNSGKKKITERIVGTVRKRPQQDHFASFRLNSVSSGPIGLLCFYGPHEIKLTRLQKDIVQLFARMICLIVDWENSQKKQAKFANEIESKNHSLREIAMIQSHDIRQPLTSIMGLITLVTSEIMEPDKHWIKMMQTATDTLDQKIKTIITQSMAEKDLKVIKYNRIVEEIEDYAILLIDTDGNIENWNKGAELIKGYKAFEIVGRNFSVFYTPQDLADGLPQNLLAQAKKLGKVMNEGWRVKKNGELFWARVLITAIHNEDDVVIGFTKMTHDLTAMKLSRDSLTKSEQINEQITNALNDHAIISLDAAGNIISWNNGAQRIKGYFAEEIMNKNFSIFYTPEDKLNKLPETLLKRALETGRTYSEGWRLKKNGDKFFASITITALYDSAGVHIGYTKVTRDLTVTETKHYSLAG